MYKNKNKIIRIDWVLVNELAIGKIPKNINDLLHLKNSGIKSVLSLCSIEEYKIPSEIETQFNHKRVVLPDHKTGKYPTIEEINNALIALEHLKSSGPVYVHCIAAMERSPLVCMAWLIKHHSMTSSQALDYLMQIHPGTSPLPRQLSLLDNIK